MLPIRKLFHKLLSGLLLIISHSHKFGYIAIPKTGSTSVACYLSDSGLLEDTDIYANKAVKKFKEEVARLNPEDNPKFGRNTRIGQISLAYVHTKYKDAVIDNPEIKDYRIYATIRNPLDRALSGAVMFRGNNKDGIVSFIEDILSSRFIFSVPQHEYFEDNAILWPTEKLHEKITGFITTEGGSVRGCWQCRNNNSADYKNYLGIDLTQRLLDFYSKDFELWENAMKSNSESKAHNLEAV